MKDEPYLPLSRHVPPETSIKLRGRIILNWTYVQAVETDSCDVGFRRVHLVGSSRIPGAQLGDEVELTAGAVIVAGRRWKGRVVTKAGPLPARSGVAAGLASD